jgi:ubiquinone biosynthesis protein
MARPHFSQSRLRHIVTTLMLEGLSVPLARMQLSRCSSLSCRIHCSWQRWSGQKQSQVPWPLAMKNAMIKLGPAFVKIGQILSVRTDLISQELADALHSLQSDVPTVDSGLIFEVLAQELGQDPHQVFAKIEATPLAAGSMAQIHRARYADGRELVLKIKRPGIDQIMKEDLEILILMAGLLDKYLPESRVYHPIEAAKELQNYTLRELDFSKEAQVARQVRELFRDWEKVRIPEIYHASTGLIVMEYIQGTPLDNLDQLEYWELDRHELILLGMKAVMAQIFDFGLFHADPHPGNLHATPAGELLILDFGIFGRLTPELQKKAVLLMWALLNGDFNMASLFLLKMASLEPDADIDGFRQAIEARYQEWKGSSVSEYGFARLVYEEFALGGKYGINFPANMILLSKAMLTIEGITLSVDPDLDISQAAAPYFNELKQKYFSLDQIKQSIQHSLPIWWTVLENLPLNLAQTLEQQLQPRPQFTQNKQHPYSQQASQLGKHIFASVTLSSGVFSLLYTKSEASWWLRSLGIMLTAIGLWKGLFAKE